MQIRKEKVKMVNEEVSLSKEEDSDVVDADELDFDEAFEGLYSTSD